MAQDIEQRIAEEQAKIKVPSYQDVAWDGAWKRRSAAIWAMGALGCAAGAGIGVGAALSAVAGGAALTGMLVAKSALIFSAIGISTGMAAGVIQGAPAGAAAATAKELERRMLARDIDQAIRNDPEATVVLGEDIAKTAPAPKDLSSYFNAPTSALFAAVGAAGGLIMAAAFIASGGLAGAGAAAGFAMPALTTLLGTAATNAAAVTAFSVGMGASFGAFFGVNVPRISRELIDITGHMLSGKATGTPWPESANLPEVKPVLAPIISSPAEEAPAPEKSCCHADKQKRQPNYEALVNASIAQANAEMRR